MLMSSLVHRHLFPFTGRQFSKIRTRPLALFPSELAPEVRTIGHRAARRLSVYTNVDIHRQT
jgi:hypothetical protein